MSVYQLNNPTWLINHYQTWADRCMHEYHNLNRAAYWIYALTTYREISSSEYIPVIDETVSELKSRLFLLLDKDPAIKKSYFISRLRGYQKCLG